MLNFNLGISFIRKSYFLSICLMLSTLNMVDQLPYHFYRRQKQNKKTMGLRFNVYDTL